MTARRAPSARPSCSRCPSTGRREAVRSCRSRPFRRGSSSSAEASESVTVTNVGSDDVPRQRAGGKPRGRPARPALARGQANGAAERRSVVEPLAARAVARCRAARRSSGSSRASPCARSPATTMPSCCSRRGPPPSGRSASACGSACASPCACPARSCVGSASSVCACVVRAECARSRRRSRTRGNVTETLTSSRVAISLHAPWRSGRAARDRAARAPPGQARDSRSPAIAARFADACARSSRIDGAAGRAFWVRL